MSLHEQCNTLHQRLIKKINSWPPDTVSTNTLISNLSNNFSYISNNFTYKGYNFNNLSANFSGNSIKSTSTSNSDPPTKANSNQNGKLPSPSSFAPTTNGKSSSSPSSCTSDGKPTSNELKPNGGQETDLSDGKSLKSNTPVSSPTHSQASSNSIVQVNNTKLDEDLIDVICKLNQKCEFLDRFGQRHDYTGKQVGDQELTIFTIHSSDLNNICSLLPGQRLFFNASHHLLVLRVRFQPKEAQDVSGDHRGRQAAAARA